MSNPTRVNPSSETLRFMEHQTKINAKLEASLVEIHVKLAEVKILGDNILAQTKKTNGRVAVNEDKISGLVGWRNMFIGGGFVISIAWSLFTFIY